MSNTFSGNGQWTAKSWGFAALWVLPTTLGWGAGFAICQLIKADQPSCIPIDGAILGSCLGIAQWFFLRQSAFIAKSWIVASILGLSAGKAVADFLAQIAPAPLSGGLGGLVIGVALGFAQWFVLRRQAVKSGWWLLANAIAWGIGWSIISLVDEPGGEASAGAYLIGGIGAMIAGAITGTSLTRLLSPRQV